MAWINLFILLLITCVRQHCSQTIANTPITVNVYAEEKSQVNLTDIVCTHNSTIRVDMGPVVPSEPCGTCFAIYKLPPSTNFQLFFLPSQGNLTYSDAREYNITATCTDDTTSVSTVINVRVITNEPPKFGAPSFIVTGIDARTTLKDAQIYTVSDATDPDGDTIFYNITVYPASSTNKYEIGLTDGIIRAKENLASECFPTVVFFVYIHDKRNVLIGPKVVTVQFSAFYTVPYISSLNKVITVSEDLATGDTVGPASITAVDNSGNTISYNVDTAPVSAAYLFEVNAVGTAKLQLRNKLNYESGMQFINVTIRPSNGFCTPDVFYLYIKVVDANDPPVLTPKEIVTFQNEGAVTYNPGFVFTDEDLVDSATYSIIAGNIGSLFSINSFTGVITSPNYDIDGAANPVQVNLTIQVEDVKGPSTDNATVIINFLDINDFPPIMTAPIFTGNVQDCTPAGSVVGIVVATDTVDTALNGNNVVECIPNSNGYLTVLSTCAVILNTSIPANTVSTLYVTAQDLGKIPKQQQSSPVPFVVTSVPCTTTTTVTPPTATTATTTATVLTSTTTTTATPTVGGIDSLIDAVNGDDGTGNIWWIVIACIIACIGLAIAAFVISRYIVPRCRDRKLIQRKQGSGANNRTSPVNQNQSRSNTQRNAQKPVTPREVKPYETNQGPEAYKIGNTDNRGVFQPQKNVWHGMGQQPGKGFDL